MDIIIAFLLVIVASGLWFQKPLQINLNHTHEIINEPTPEQTISEADQKKADEEAKKSFDNVITTIQEIMGVNTDEETNRTSERR